MIDWLRTTFEDAASQRWLLLVAGLLVITTIVRVVQRTFGARIGDPDTRYRWRKGAAFTGYAVAVVLALSIFGTQHGGVTVALGVAGAGIAFALQEVIASVAGWLALSFSSFYRPGDRVQLGGIKGDVIDIGMLRTTLMEIGQWVDGDLYNGRIVRVANSFVFKEPVFNYSADFPFLWDEIKLPIRFGSDRDTTRAILRAAADEVVGQYTGFAKEAWSEMVRKFRIEDAMVEPMVSFVATDNWLAYTLRYVVDYRRRRAVKDQLFTTILAAIEATGGRVQTASATFELTGMPPINVTTSVAEPPHGRQG
jgi:small-conductance mechanosensitive channel